MIQKGPIVFATRKRGSDEVRPRNAEPIRLTTHGLEVHFAGVKAVDGVDLELNQGEIIGLIGPNGAGKTTALNAITGFQRPTSGSVSVGGRDATGWSPQMFARAGVVRTFQNACLFPGLTAIENVEVAGFGTGASRRAAHERAIDLLESFGLTALAFRDASTLAYGDQRRLTIARALATRPALVLLDEPAAGLDETESDELLATLAHVRDSEGCGLMIIEHDMRLIMRLCDTVHVLDYGKTLVVGAPVEVQQHKGVQEAYLGTSDHRSRSRAVSPL